MTIDQTDEETLDPHLEIVDAHHHLGNHLDPPYELADLLSDTASGHRVVQTVFVECGLSWDLEAVPPQRAPVGEVRRVAQLAQDRSPQGGAIIAGIVAHADLRFGAAVGPVLDELTDVADGLLVGVRHVTAWDASPDVFKHRTRPTAHMMSDPMFRAGFAEIAKRGLVFDAWQFHPQLPELIDLVDAFTDVRFVVDHLGGPLGVGPYHGRHREILAGTRHHLAKLSRRDNVVLKLGGIAMPMMAGPLGERGAPPTSIELAEYWGPDLQWCIETFGAARSMFESNFPMDRATCSYRVLWNAFKRVAAEASVDEKQALFSASARAAYGLPDGASNERPTDPCAGSEKRDASAY